MMRNDSEDSSLQVNPGDIVFTAGRSLLSRLIRWASRGIGETRTHANHVGIITGYGSLLTAQVTEALWRVRTHCLWDRYAGSGHKVCIVRPLNVQEHELKHISRVARGYTGRKYGWWKIGLHFGDKLLGGAYFFRRIAFIRKYPICSFVVADAYGTQGYDFGCKVGEAQPDDIWDYVMRSDNYVVIRPLEELDA